MPPRPLQPTLLFEVACKLGRLRARGSRRRLRRRVVVGRLPRRGRSPLGDATLFQEFCGYDLLEFLHHLCWSGVAVQESRLHELVLDRVEPLPTSEELASCWLGCGFGHVFCSCQGEFLGGVGSGGPPAAAFLYHKMWCCHNEGVVLDARPPMVNEF